MNKPVLLTVSVAAAVLLTSCVPSNKEVMESEPVRILTYSASEADLANCFVQRHIEIEAMGTAVATRLGNVVKISGIFDPNSLNWELTLAGGTAELRSGGVGINREGREAKVIAIFDFCEKQYGTAS